MYYSVFEQHKDGSWWYHPGLTWESEKDAEQDFKERFWWDLGRPHKIIKHTNELFQDYSSHTRNFKTLEFSGIPVGTIEQC